MVALRKSKPRHMTLAEFLSWEPADRSGARWQLVDGVPVAMAPTTETHAALQGEIGRVIGNHLLDTRNHCRLLSQPGVVPRIGAERNFRIPDLGVTCAPPSSGLTVADPVLLIEILSPSNEDETRANIWAYATIPSGQEILAVHSTSIEAELLRRLPDGAWPDSPVILQAADTLTLASIGFSTHVSALYRTTALAS